MRLESTIEIYRFMFIPFYGIYMTQNFCIKTSTGGNDEWPRGKYCIFAYGGCPSGFRCGSVKWDDHSYALIRNLNRRWGRLPQGTYDQNTIITYACRSDGSVNDEIMLPTQKPFYLMRFGTQCQKVLLSSKPCF